MHDWIVPLAALMSAIGVIGQWYVGDKASARRDGAVDEKLKSHGARILQLEDDSKDHSGRIATIEGRLDSAVGAHRR